MPPVAQEFDSLRSVFETVLEQEVAVTDSINRIIGVCRRESDYATEELMKWYVKEQVEEEYIARRCLELIDQIPADQVYYLDKNLPALPTTKTHSKPSSVRLIEQNNRSHPEF